MCASSRLFPSVLQHHGLASSSVLEGNQYHRLWGASWLHTHWTHCVLNVFMLFCLGYGTQCPLSTAGFLFIYLVSSVGGNVLALYVGRDDQSSQPHAVGAASGISGVLLASLTLSPSLTLTISRLAFSLPLWPLAIVFLAVSVFALKPRHSTMIHDAHLGGALTGLILSPVVAPEPLQTTLWLAIGISLPTVVLFYTLVKAPEIISMKPSLLLVDHATSCETQETRTGISPSGIGYETLEDEMNALLDRIAQHGYQSLNDYERERLQRIANVE